MGFWLARFIESSWLELDIIHGGGHHGHVTLNFFVFPETNDCYNEIFLATFSQMSLVLFLLQRIRKNEERLKNNFVNYKASAAIVLGFSSILANNT